MIEDIFFTIIAIGGLMALGIGMSAGLVKLAIFVFTWAIQ